MIYITRKPKRLLKTNKILRGKFNNKMVCSKKMIIFFKLEFKENQITSQKLSPFLKLPWISLIPVRNLVHSFMKLDKMILKFTWKYISKTTQEYVLYSHSYFLLTVSLPPPCYKHVFEEGWGGKTSTLFWWVFSLLP